MSTDFLSYERVRSIVAGEKVAPRRKCISCPRTLPVGAPARATCWTCWMEDSLNGGGSSSE